jgi:hypothetical protein
MFPTVERDSTTCPQAQMICAALYSGWIPAFMISSQCLILITQPLARFNWPVAGRPVPKINVFRPARESVAGFGRHPYKDIAKKWISQ